jgi:unsaturated chondroitin disaccharide hydrolase
MASGTVREQVRQCRFRREHGFSSGASPVGALFGRYAERYIGRFVFSLWSPGGVSTGESRMRELASGPVRRSLYLSASFPDRPPPQPRDRPTSVDLRQSKTTGKTTMDASRRTAYLSALEFAQHQVAATIRRTPDYFPIYTEGGSWHHAGELWTDWTGGFFAGMMWKFAQTSDDTHWRQQAEHYSKLLESRQHDRKVHDLGFIFLNTYRPWYELTGDEALRQVLIQAGRTLSMRFQEKGLYLCSFVAPESLFIDIMMNVPIIFHAAQETDDEALREIALAHCRTTRDRIVRADGSTAHEGIFDLESGEFLRESTHQGLRPDSCWARGLAWSLYGYSQVYGYTGSDEFLEVAIRNADYWVEHLPQDRVSYWDFDADLDEPPPWGSQKDSSASAIAASGLLDLADQTADVAKSQAYRRTALEMLDALVSTEYLARETPGWEGILRHGVYHTAKNLGVDESVMWGEFFLVEALCKALDRDQ